MNNINNYWPVRIIPFVQYFTMVLILGCQIYDLYYFHKIQKECAKCNPDSEVLKQAREPFWATWNVLLPYMIVYTIISLLFLKKLDYDRGAKSKRNDKETNKKTL